MSTFQSEIQTLVQDFVAQITDAWKRAVSEALTGVGSGAGGRATRRGSGGGGGGAASRRKGEKRTADELDGLAEKFQEHVKSNPGLRIEQINKQLGTTTKDLQLPIRKLIADGAVKAKGEKRSTQYFPGEGTPKRRAKKK
jgi:hypothetical protein